MNSAEDGISYTFSITPGTLGKDEDQKITNLVNMLDGYFAQTGHHINVNVFDRSLLLDAMDHPEKYPQLNNKSIWICSKLCKINERTTIRCNK